MTRPRAAGKRMTQKQKFGLWFLLKYGFIPSSGTPEHMDMYAAWKAAKRQARREGRR